MKLKTEVWGNDILVGIAHVTCHCSKPKVRCFRESEIFDVETIRPVIP